MAEYNGTIELISGITPKNNGGFPLVNAKDVAFYEEVTTEEGTTVEEIRLTDKIQQVGVSETQKQEIVNQAVDKTLKSDTITSIQTNVTTNANEIKTLDTSVKALQAEVDAFEGDNKDLNITFDSTQGNTLFLHTGDKPNNDQDSDGYNVIASTVITGTGGGASASYKLLLVQPTDEVTNRTILYGNSMSIRYSIELTSLEDPTNLLSDKVNMYLYVEDTLVKTFVETADAGATKTLDISEYLALGYNSIKLTASYTEILEDSGEKVTTRSTKRWYVNTIQMYLTSTFDDAAVKTTDVNFSYTPFGDLEKTIYFKLDDKDFGTEVTSLSNRALSKIIPMQSHGSHTFEVYCTGVIEGTTIESDHLFYDIMFAEEGNAAPIIRAVPTYEAVEQYTNNPVEYSLYVKDELIAPITLQSYDVKDGVKTLETQTTLSIDRAEKVWNYTPQTAGTKELVLTSGETVKTLNITVKAFPHTITPVTSGLELDFDPTGRTNQDTDYDVFHNNVYDKDGNEIPLTWSLSDNFDWVNGGWKTDAEGATYFCVKAGTTATINYKLFNDAYTVAGANNSKGNGKEFKVIFKTTNVAQADTTWLECQKVAATGTNQVGIQMDVHNAYVKSSLDSLTIPYSEEDIIEFDMNIIPMTFTSEGTVDETVKDISMIMTYEDGTPVQPKIISDVNTSFKQLDTTEDPAAFITIGSQYCDVHIYRMKAYSQFLSDSDVLSNFIADARSGEEKANRYLRNLIYDGTKLTPESVADRCRDLRVIKISAPRFTTDKKEKIKDTTIEMIYRNGDPTLDNWIAKNCQHSGQGTSSNEYGFSGRNLDLIMNKSGYEEDKPEIKPIITLGDKVTETKKITLSRKSVPTNYLNVKVNIASSEHSNNSLLQKRYDRYLPYKSPAKVREEFAKNTMEFFNCVVFIQEADEDLTTHKEFNDTGWHFYAMGNVGDSKKTDSSRTNDPNDKKEFCVEIMDWNRYLSSFPTDTMVLANQFTKTEKDETTVTETTSYIFLLPENLGEDGILFEKDSDGNYVHSLDTEIAENTAKYYVDILEQDDFSEDYTYGFRYLEDDEDKDQIAEAKAKWIEFYRYVTQPLTASDDIAKWKSEFSNWFIKDAALYYYIFTLRYTMVDNRAKNSFWHYGKHFITQAEVDAAAAELQAAQAELKVATDALTAIDKTTNAEAYATQEAVVAAKQAIVDDAQAAVDRTTWFTVDDVAAAINDGYRFDFWDYDNDTALGIDNAGKLEMSYGIEDNDKDASGACYFRAADSLFFQRVLTYFASDLETAFNNYEAANAAVFSSESLINEFDAWQSQFPEELWRLDYERKYKRTYVNGSGSEWDNAIAKKADKRFLADMMNGKKKYQRRQFERNQDFYMSSKFIGNVNKEDTITLRGAGAISNVIVTPDYDLHITPYANMYINLHDGTKTYYHKRCYAGVEYEIPYSTEVLDFIYIRGGSKIQSLGDLSLMYLQTATLGTGEKLKQITLGNATEGYENKSLTELNITKDNKLLENLNLRNLPSLVGSMPITAIPSIKTLDARGTNYVSAVFANSGLIETAYLPASIQILTLNNLYFLKTLTLDDYSNVQQLLLADCPNFTNDLALVEQCTALRKARITDVDWTVKTTSLLNRLANCTGIGADGTTEVNNSVLTGKVYIDGYIRQSEIDKYKEVWGATVVQVGSTVESTGDLIITYKQLMPQHSIIFKSKDVNTGAETVLYSELIDQGTELNSATHDPIVTGKINTPATQYSDDGQFAYIYQSWATADGQTLDSITISNADVIFYAIYKQETRLYTVTWKDDNNDAAVDIHTAQVAWGTNAEFKGTLPQPKSDDGNNYYLFNGWDKTSTFITKDTVIYPTWVSSNPYTLNSKPTAEMTAEDIYGLRETKTVGTYFNAGGETITMQLGYMPEYDNITSQVLIADKTVFDGATTYVDTDIELFNEDKGFTLAIDYEAAYRDTNISARESIVSSYFDGKNGFKIVTQNNAIPQIWYKSQSVATNVGYTAPGKIKDTSTDIYTHREICVIRKVKGDNNLYVYTNNRFSNVDIAETKLESTSFSALENIKLCFGAARNSAGEHSEYFTGNIYYAKLWNNDIGADECKKVCSWVYDTLDFEFVGANRYYYPDTDRYCQATFVATKLLDDMIYYNNNAASGNETKSKEAYMSSDIRAWLNSKMLLGPSITWQQVIKPVAITSLEGSYAVGGNNQVNTTTHITADSFFIPAAAEVSEGYASDSHHKVELGLATTQFKTFSQDADRVRTLFNLDEAKPYWLRTPYKTIPDYNLGVTSTGILDYKEGNDTAEVFYRSLNYNRRPAGVLLCFSI